ncbi:hypothetical protein [Bradyrhizobium sp. AS23.2]|uniref:hypothetical protein n=1 Tax=Bradyrhizobium sp. AS23.2 TaxID=1680155 RepID=UPI00093F7BA9|nr:hypothetical protein [Bradyrhizobium sp. AS23.2]
MSALPETVTDVERRYGFAQVAIIPTPFGDAVSGQMAWDEDRNVVGVDDIGRQLKRSLKKPCGRFGIRWCETR